MVVGVQLRSSVGRPTRGDARPRGDVRRPGALSRSDAAAMLIGDLAARAVPGERLGTKDTLREVCAVSVGTFNEALKIAQSRGVVHVRPGPGGGIFAAHQSPLVRFGHSVLTLDQDAPSVAEAVRMRDALDPLLVEDAVTYLSAAAKHRLLREAAAMRVCVDKGDTLGFVHANWRLHRLIADISPNVMLRSVYISLLDLVESHTLSVEPADDVPLPAFVEQRLRLHEDLVQAIVARDRELAALLIVKHNTTSAPTFSVVE